MHGGGSGFFVLWLRVSFLDHFIHWLQSAVCGKEKSVLLFECLSMTGIRS
jgi:hypothetical protein